MDRQIDIWLGTDDIVLTCVTYFDVVAMFESCGLNISVICYSEFFDIFLKKGAKIMS
jgi:hypothetical protein